MSKDESIEFAYKKALEHRDKEERVLGFEENSALSEKLVKN